MTLKDKRKDLILELVRVENLTPSFGDWLLGVLQKQDKEVVEEIQSDNELNVIELKKRLKDNPDNEFLLGRIQGIRTAEDNMEERLGRFK